MKELAMFFGGFAVVFLVTIAAQRLLGFDVNFRFTWIFSVLLCAVLFIGFSVIRASHNG